MSQPVRTGILIGIIGLVIVLAFGGWSSVLAGIITGATVGMLVEGRMGSAERRPFQDAAIAGLAAGAMILIGQLVHDLVFMPWAGRTAEIEAASTWAAGGAGLILAAGVAAAVAVVNALAEPRRRQGLLALLLLFLVAYPFLDQATKLGWIETMISVLIFIVLALGLNIVVGYAGLLDLGYAAFFAIGAYTTGLFLSPHLCNQTTVNCQFYQAQWGFWLVIWIAAAVAAIAGLILGAPTLPLRGDYLAIVTLGFGEIVPIVFRNLTQVVIHEPITQTCLLGCDKAINLTAGEQGINPIARPSLPGVGTFETGQFVPWYVLIIAIIALSVFLILRLRDSRLGRSWAAMREDELAASAMGIDIVRTKLLAFAMGATFSGFGGAFYASYISAIFPSVFDFTISVIILCMVILGGLGSIPGVIVGGLIIMLADRLFLPEVAKLMRDILDTSVLPNVTNPAVKDFLTTSVDPTQWRLLLFGLTLVIMMLVRPEGLIPSSRRRAEIHAEEPEGVEALTVQEADNATQLRSIDARDVRAQ